MTKDAKTTKDVDPDCMLKSRFAAARLRDIVIGLKDPRRELIINRGWGFLLDICSFSAPKGLLEWIIQRIDPELGEFRNTRNDTSIVFNKEMVATAIGLPRGTRPVVLTGEHEESPYREFYKIEYNTAGRRAPIHHAEKMLENENLDAETWFRTFFLVVIGTYFFPGTSIMLPLEYLGSLGDSELVREYDWAEQIFQHTMSEIKAFQEKMRKAAKDGNIKPLWVGGCLPWIAIVYMDHLDFPVSTLSSYRINYAVPRASHVTDKDFKFVMQHDRNKLTLKAHTYGKRPFRPFHNTPYANVNANLGNVAPQAHILPEIAVANSNHLGQDVPQDPTTRTNSSIQEELPEYIKTLIVKHNNIWMKDVERVTARFKKIHDKRITEFASEVLLAFKNNATSHVQGVSSPHGTSTPIASPPRASTPIVSSVRDEVSVEAAVGNSVPPCGNQTPNNTQFWEEATRIADQVEHSVGKTTNMEDPSSIAHVHIEDQPIFETSGPSRRGDDIECPSFDLLPAGETWTQHLAGTNQPPPPGSAQVEKHAEVVDNTSAAKLRVKLQTATENIDAKTQILDGGQSSSPVAIVPKPAIVPDVVQSSPSVACTVGTQTQEKKNRKKRAFLGINDEANMKKIKKLKVTDKSKEVYDTYIRRRCVRPPVEGEPERPHFVNFGNYHISYEHFREALKPRGKIDNHVMELYIRNFNMVVNIPTTSEPMCTKFAFSQSLTAKLSVHEDKFEPKSCLKEFQAAYKEHHLKSKDMFYFAIVDNGHWVLVCINLILKEVNVLDSMMTANNTRIYEKAHFLVNNFITLAAYAKAFPKINFNQFVQNNTQDLRQQTTLFDCGVFVMIFMKLWDGKIMKSFSTDIIDHRMVITLEIMQSDLNKADPTWVLKKK